MERAEREAELARIREDYAAETVARKNQRIKEHEQTRNHILPVGRGAPPPQPSQQDMMHSTVVASAGSGSVAGTGVLPPTVGSVASGFPALAPQYSSPPPPYHAAAGSSVGIAPPVVASVYARAPAVVSPPRGALVALERERARARNLSGHYDASFESTAAAVGSAAATGMHSPRSDYGYEDDFEYSTESAAHTRLVPAPRVAAPLPRGSPLKGGVLPAVGARAPRADDHAGSNGYVVPPPSQLHPVLHTLHNPSPNKAKGIVARPKKHHLLNGGPALAQGYSPGGKWKS
jgi:hypothetical protein